jgi:hypothetical protein
VTRPFTIAVTGHRLGRLSPGAPAVIRAAVRELVGRHPGAVWVAGGAIGVDQIVAGELLRLRERVQLVLPFSPAVQSVRWSPAQRQTLLSQVANAMAVEVLYQAYDLAAYHERNKRLVELADLVVAFFDGRPTGGTAATIAEARRRAVPVEVVPVR